MLKSERAYEFRSGDEVVLETDAMEAIEKAFRAGYREAFDAYFEGYGTLGENEANLAWEDYKRAQTAGQ